MTSILEGLREALRAVRRDRQRRAQSGTAEPHAVPPASHRYCLRCGYTGAPKTVTPGSILIELVLWLFMIVPGLVYSLWRINRRHDACPKCGSADLIPADSPRALALRS